MPWWKFWSWPWKRHRHNATPIAVKHLNVGPIGGMPITVVLWNCPCGNRGSEMVQGTWTLEELKHLFGTRGESDSDLVRQLISR